METIGRVTIVSIETSYEWILKLKKQKLLKKQVETFAFFCAKFLNDSFLGQNEKKITIFYQNYLWRRSTTTFKHKTFKKSIF